MSFLSTDDYRVVTCPADLEIICQSSDEIRQQAERTAMEEVAGYVRTRYDIDEAFAKSDVERNPLLVQLTVCIALWWLGQWLPGMIGGEMRQTLYDNAIGRLKDIHPRLPRISRRGRPRQRSRRQSYPLLLHEKEWLGLVTAKTLFNQRLNDVETFGEN